MITIIVPEALVWFNVFIGWLYLVQFAMWTLNIYLRWKIKKGGAHD